MAAERLSGLDTAFLCLDRDVTPMQLGALTIFRSPGPVNPGRLMSLLVERVRLLPLLRRRVAGGWFPPGSAVWEDTPGFRAEHHVRLHRLGGAAGADEAAQLAADLVTEPLSRQRPLWELHLLTGLTGRRFAVVVKLHHAFADGLAALDLGAGLLDGAAVRPVRAVPQRPAPRTAGSLPGAGLVDQAVEALAMAGSVLRSARLPVPCSPLMTTSSGLRSLGLARLDLRQVRRIRAGFGGTVNDVLLAVVAGALREWALGRGTPVRDRRGLRALIPVSIRARVADRPGGNLISGYLCPLPVAEADPVVRLRAIQESMRRCKQAGLRSGPGAIPLLADRLPPALHRLLTPAAGPAAPLLFDLLVTSVPVPAPSLRLDGAELEEIFPIAPLAAGHALAVAISCFRGTAYVGLHADRMAVKDLPDLAAAVTASVVGLGRAAAA